MDAITFQRQLSRFPVFSLEDVRKAFPDFSYRQIDRWAKKGYLLKIRQGFYTLAGQPLDQPYLFFTANNIYRPSYISLETALKYYGLIPEEVFQLTSVSTRKTIRFATPLGNFRYNHVKPSLCFGYKLHHYGNYHFLIAEPEKAILDFLYLSPSLRTIDDFNSLRMDEDQFHEHVNVKRLGKYARAFDNKSLMIRLETFIKSVETNA